MKLKLTRTQNIMLGFFVVIIVGALLLCLPWATRKGETTTFINALFTSVSATCVTGLVAYDTWSHWTLFGQIVLLIQIQIGGLGFITISTFTMMMLRRKIGIEQRVLIQDSLNTLEIRGSVSLVRHIVKGTILFEGIGAVLLSLVFIPEVGFVRGLFYGLFHSVSAFCNAGFDLLGWHGPYSSLTTYYSNPIVILTVSTLVIIGGLGFLVWDDFWVHRLQVKKYRLQTKIVLSVTSFLLIVPTILFALLERNHLFAGMNGMETFLAAFFSAVTPRTAGFNSVDTGLLTSGSLFLTVLLMVIGGSPGSTAGGMKTVTLFVIFLQLKAYLFGERDCVAFKKRIEPDILQKANTILSLNLSLAVIGIMIILSCQNLPFHEVVFEVFSAIGTVGMSTGITRALGAIPRITIMCLMYAGRMGSLTIAMSLTERRKKNKISYPKESVTVG